MMKLCIMPKEPFNNKKKAKIIKDKNCYYIKKTSNQYYSALKEMM